MHACIMELHNFFHQTQTLTYITIFIIILMIGVYDGIDFFDLSMSSLCILGASSGSLRNILSESRKVLNLPPVIIFPYRNLPPIFEVLVVDKAWLGRGSLAYP